jgi:hypothetical protein
MEATMTDNGEQLEELDPNELYAVPEDQQLDYDEPDNPDGYGGVPTDLDDVPEGDEVQFIGDDEDTETYEEVDGE